VRAWAPRFAARVDDAHHGLAGEQARAGEAPVLTVDLRLAIEVGQLHQRVFAHRIGFAGERRFIGLQTFAAHHQAVGRERLADADHYQIARHQFGGSNDPARAIAPYRRHACQAATESFGRGMGAAMQKGIHPQKRNQRDQQDNGLGPLAHQAKQQTRAKQEPQHRIPEGLAQQQPPAAAGGFQYQVAAEPLGTHLDLRGRQALVRGRQSFQTIEGYGSAHVARTLQIGMVTHHNYTGFICCRMSSAPAAAFSSAVLHSVWSRSAGFLPLQGEGQDGDG